MMQSSTPSKQSKLRWENITYEFLVNLISAPSDGTVPLRKFIDALLQNVKNEDIYRY